MGNIVVIGSSNTDMILRVDHIPAAGETVLGGSFSTAAGGKGANQAVAAARAGGNVTFVACVGTDAFGRQTIESLRDEHIDVQYIRLDSRFPSGVAFIFVDDRGENSIGVAPGANGHLGAGDIAAARGAIASADFVLTQLESPLETVEMAARTAHAAGVPFMLNPAPAQSLSPALLANVGVLTPNETEAALLTGIRVDSDAEAARAADALHVAGVGIVLITLGERGTFCSDSKSGFRELVPGFNVHAVDTTGAGDVFNGAFAVAFASGAVLPSAVMFANAAAALSVTAPGAQPSIPRLDEIEALMLTRIPGGARGWFDAKEAATRATASPR